MANHSKKKYPENYFKNDTERFTNTSAANLKNSIIEYFITAGNEKLRHINVERLANIFGRNPSYISRQFSQYYGLSLNAMLTREKMFRVSKLLKGNTRRDAYELILTHRNIANRKKTLLAASWTSFITTIAKTPTNSTGTFTDSTMTSTTGTEAMTIGTETMTTGTEAMTTGTETMTTGTE
ncbi:MAG: hypothetical protein GY757_08835, partial [bacterium]|nr:hypothetical protein [bacterium]